MIYLAFDKSDREIWKKRCTLYKTNTNGTVAINLAAAPSHVDGATKVIIREPITETKILPRKPNKKNAMSHGTATISIHIPHCV